MTEEQGIIFAGVVTYEPDLTRLEANLRAISGQVTSILVFDNGSQNWSGIDDLCISIGNCLLYRHGENSGIAFALNWLVAAALSRGAHWLLTLDQDSVSPPGMVAALRGVATPLIPLVTPHVIDINRSTVAAFEAQGLPSVQFYKRAAWRGAITSGSLVHLPTIVAIGGFDSSLFIDYVDYDLNQRLLLAGYRIARCNRTYLLHEVGRAKATWLWVPRRSIDGDWAFERFFTFGHSSRRCYYKARNRIIFTRKYGRFIGLTNEGIWQIPQQFALTVLFEDDRVAKALAFGRGVFDGVRGR